MQRSAQRTALSPYEGIMSMSAAMARRSASVSRRRGSNPHSARTAKRMQATNVEAGLGAEMPDSALIASVAFSTASARLWQQGFAQYQNLRRFGTTPHQSVPSATSTY